MSQLCVSSIVVSPGETDGEHISIPYTQGPQCVSEVCGVVHMHGVWKAPCLFPKFAGRCMCLDALLKKIPQPGFLKPWPSGGEWMPDSFARLTCGPSIHTDRLNEMFQVDPATPCDPSKNKKIDEILQAKDAWKGVGAAEWGDYKGTWPEAANHKCCKGLVCRRMFPSVDITNLEKWTGKGLKDLKEAFIVAKTPLCLEPVPK